MNKLLRIKMLQYDVQWEDIRSNLQQLDKLYTSENISADITLLPEMFATGFTMNPGRFTDTDIQTILHWMLEKSAHSGSVLMGSVPFNDNGNYYNRLLITFKDGTHSFYNKRHLFKMGQEHQQYKPGDFRKIVTVKGWKVLPLICYDLRFPVWSRNDIDYDLLVYVSNWPAVRNDVWNTLLKARAIENQTYVAGLNRTGTDGRGIFYSGGSKVISPKGDIILEMGEKECIKTVELDGNAMLEFRKKFPVLSDRDSFIIK